MRLLRSSIDLRISLASPFIQSIRLFAAALRVSSSGIDFMRPSSSKILFSSLSASNASCSVNNPFLYSIRNIMLKRDFEFSVSMESSSTLETSIDSNSSKPICICIVAPLWKIV